MQNTKSTKWYLGLDIGTDSVGWTVTDEQYKILKYKNNAMWGVMLFDAANQSAERRTFRTARRRLDRRQQRILMLQELFAKEITSKDEKFFVRLKESALYFDDKSTQMRNLLFCDKNYKDKDYHKQYPTIHHLISELMKNSNPHDVRLVYLACAYILAHRGHFLIDVDKDNINDVTDFNIVYKQLMDWFDSMEYSRPWECSANEFCNIMKKKLTSTAKEKELKILLWNGKKPTSSTLESQPSSEHIIAMLSGRKVKLSDIFKNEEYKELENNTVCLASSDFNDIIVALATELYDGEADLLQRMKALYDWSLLTEILNGKTYISDAKVETYEQHKSDLKFLKYLIKEYVPSKYNEVFLEASDKANYTSYSYNVKSVKTELSEKFKKCKRQEDFCKYITSIVKNISVKECDKKRFDDMMKRLELNSFCPKQVNTDNSVIPYQLYWNELKTILDNACKYLSFLNYSDNYGEVKEKILSLMEFRIPYYVGPLVSRNKSDNSWIVRRKDGKIYPWNFNEMVDKDRSEQEFIRRMTCKCTYLAGNDVISKNSLLYSKFMVLNEINNLKINDVPISVECKQHIFEELFMKKRIVSKSAIEKFLISNNFMKSGDIVSGIDIKVKSSLKSYHDFKRLLESKKLDEHDAEKIIERITFTNDKERLKNWLKENYPLSNDDLRYVSNLKYSDFGRLSNKFLTEINDIDFTTGEIKNPGIITMLWETNKNLMQLLSNEYNYAQLISRLNSDYYKENPSTVMQRLDEMYISNAVKRPIIRTLDIVKELRGIMKSEPEKIFIEMARDVDNSKKGKRTKSRRDQITELYKAYGKEEVRELLEQLESKSDGELRSEKLFLYFIQLGKCMYTGKHIDIDKIGTFYDVDHIFPQSRIKDDSLDNKVLVYSELNRTTKKDIYPIPEEIRKKMHGFWESLYEKNLISDKKRKRLERNYGFTDDELADFINRQLVETRQSTKAVAELLKEIIPDTDIVYVKAGLVSEFRHEYEMLKCREINDLHHAKDAYLNIVMGNVYDVKFTRNPINFIKSGGKYTLNLTSMLKHDISRGDVTAWNGNGETLLQVKNVMQKNNIKFVRYSKCQKGQLFDIMPMRKGLGQVPLKSGKIGNIDKYGGYNKATISCFYLVKYNKKGKDITTLIPIELRFCNSIKTVNEIEEYCRNNLKMSNPIVLLNGRKIKLNSLWLIDGFRSHLSSKTGSQVVLKGGMQLILDQKWEVYIKKIQSFCERYSEAQKNNYVLPKITKFDKLSVEENNELYRILFDKLDSTPYKVLMPTPIEILKKNRNYFAEQSIEEQTIILSQIITLFGCRNTSGSNLTKINGAKSSGRLYLGMELNSKRFSEIYLVDQSPTGLFERKSDNLLKL